MINLGTKTKQLFLGMTTGFSLAMVSPINLVWSRSSETVVASAILEPIPNSVLIGVALVIVTLHLVMALISMGLGLWKIGQGESSLETLRIGMLVSAVGIAIGLISLQLNSPLLSSISLVTIVFNSGTLLTSYLATFVSKNN